MWPSLTVAETLHLLGRVHGRVDVAYRDALVERFQPWPTPRTPRCRKSPRSCSRVRPCAACCSRPTPWKIGQIARLAAISSFVLAVVVLVLSVLGFAHLRRVPATEEVLAGQSTGRTAPAAD